MALPTHVTVTAPEGRRTPVAKEDGRAVGGGPMFVTNEHVDRVRYSATTMRSIARGDLILCNMDGSPVASADLAVAPRELEGGRLKVAKAAPKEVKP